MDVSGKKKKGTRYPSSSHGSYQFPSSMAISWAPLLRRFRFQGDHLICSGGTWWTPVELCGVPGENRYTKSGYTADPGIPSVSGRNSWR